MIWLILTFAIGSLIGLSFIIWLHTRKGKEWHAKL
nr:MAG TPA: YtxH-like protein [Caudoviricetes sp.]